MWRCQKTGGRISQKLEPAQRLGNYLEGIDGFDAEYFGIAPREASQIDPQQRLLLEVVWEALWDAGLEPASLRKPGRESLYRSYNNDYARMHFSDRKALGAYPALVHAYSVGAGRVSYLLDIRGPSICVDTACSSSLVAAHMAVESLRSGESSLAIVGASSLKVLPDEVVVFRNGACWRTTANAKPSTRRLTGSRRERGGAAVNSKGFLEVAAGWGSRARGDSRDGGESTTGVGRC